MVDSFLLTLPTLAALLYTPWAHSLQGMCPPIGCPALEHLDSGVHRYECESMCNEYLSL